MTTYLKMDKPDSALFYFGLIKDKFQGRPDLAFGCYEELSEYYSAKGQSDKALVYYEKKDSVDRFMESKNEKNYLSLLELEYEARLDKEKLAKLHSEAEKSAIVRRSLITGFGLTVLFGLVLFFQQKQKSRKKRALILEEKARIEAEQKLMATELEHSELKKKYLNDELEYTNKELTSFASTIVQNQTLLNDFKNNISTALKEKSIGNIKNQLRDLNLRLQQIFSHNAQRSEFIKRSRELNHSLIFQLKTQFPQLTENDVNLLILILLKFSSKEISAFYNIAHKSVRQRRYRLRRKLNIEDRESFESFFRKVFIED